MEKTPGRENLLAILTSFNYYVANIPRRARYALLTNNFRCMPETLAVPVRGYLPMSVPHKTIITLCAAIFAVACFATASLAQASQTYARAGQPFTGQDLDSDVYMRDIYSRKSHWYEAYYNGQKHSPTQEEYQEMEGPVDPAHELPVPLEKGPDIREKVDPDRDPTWTVAKGFILPTGYYMWQGGGPVRTGIVPNPTLAMPGFESPLNVADSGAKGTWAPFVNMIDPSRGLRNTQTTNWEMAAMAAGSVQMLTELRSDPTRWKEAMRAAQEAKQSSSADNQAAMSERDEDTAFNTCAFVPLINIANENAWVPCGARDPFKRYEQAAWMVGRMYKEVYIPMAILFLLPGAIMTQVKVVIRTGFLFGGNDEDLVSPWSGIMRSVIAVFLIPATQLFVSYAIDVGNSLTYEVTEFRPYFDLDRIFEWRRQQTYNIARDDKMNHIRNIRDRQHEGKMKLRDEPDTKAENQHYVTSTGQQWFNTLESLMSQGMICLNAFQFVMMEYLFLMGPIAAALFAWPGVHRETFKKVFANWMNAVVLVSLWKFWWSIILLAMSTRLYMMQQDGGLPDPTDPYEMFMAAAFGAMLMYIPFNPFDFRPGDLVSSVLEKAQQQVSKGGGGAASVGSAGSAGGGGGGGGGQNAGISGGVGGG